MLPFLLKRAMVLAAVCLIVAGMIVFCAGVLQESNGVGNKLRIGYVAEKNVVTDLAVSYVQDMESVKSICSLEAVTEQQGKQLLENGDLSALIVLPKDIINEILSGSNTPATLYLPGNAQGAVPGGGLSAVGSMLFEELASAAIGMLGTAQAEIYASDAILQELAAGSGAGIFGDGFLQSMYDDINRFNLEVVAGREKLFQIKTLSLTENNTYTVYYGSALFTVYALFAGLFMGKFCKRSSLQQMMADRRIGVGYVAQLGARCLAGSMLMLLVLLLPFLVSLVLYLMPQVGSVLAIEMTWQGLVSLILITGFVTVYDMMIYQMIEKRESALVVTGVLAVLQAYLSGCLIPSVLLPKAVASVGKYLPAAMIKKGITLLFTGDVQDFSYVASGLCVWGGCLFLCTVLSMHIGERNKSAVESGKRPVKFHVPSLGMVMFRRLMHKKSMWFSLGLIVVLSAVILQVEKSSETQVKVAVYDESGNYIERLKAYDGLVQFEQYGSDEAVQDAVYRGRVECGYVLPKTLMEDMIVQHAAREIHVYQDADAVAVPVVNEILFERIFRQVSLKWFEDYVSQNSVIKKMEMDEESLRQIARDCFDGELLAGTTFRFEVRRMDVGRTDISGDDSDDERTLYPIYVVAAIAIILCVLQGVVQVVTDIRAQSFYKRNRVTASILTLILPIMMGLLCACLLIMIGAGGSL